MNNLQQSPLIHVKTNVQPNFSWNHWKQPSGLQDAYHVVLYAGVACSGVSALLLATPAQANPVDAIAPNHAPELPIVNLPDVTIAAINPIIDLPPPEATLPSSRLPERLSLRDDVVQTQQAIAPSDLSPSDLSPSDISQPSGGNSSESVFAEPTAASTGEATSTPAASQPVAIVRPETFYPEIPPSTPHPSNVDRSDQPTNFHPENTPHPTLHTPIAHPESAHPESIPSSSTATALGNSIQIGLAPLPPTHSPNSLNPPNPPNSPTYSTTPLSSLHSLTHSPNSPNPPTHLPPEFWDYSISQVTSVSQLSDVEPDHWSYQALQNLVERYGVIAGYPDGTFRGDRALTRYEFAAGLNAVMDTISDLIAAGMDELPTRQDLEVLRRLQDEFAAELTDLQGRVGDLEERTTTLESQQFSPIMRLNGQAIFGLSAAGGGDPPGTGNGNLSFTHSSEMQISGSFSGRDVLRIGLTAGSGGLGFANPQNLNTNMALQSYQTETFNRFELSTLEYRFAVGDRLVVTVQPAGFDLTSILTPNSIFSSSSRGAISRFGAFNPVFRIGGLDAGLGVDWLISNRARLQVGYGARDANDPSNGLFSSNHRAFGVQLLTRPFYGVTTGIAYVNAFDQNGFLNTFTGSNNADISGGFNERSAIHAFSGTLQWEVTPGLILGTWGGLIITDSLESDAAALSTTYMFSMGFPDPFGRQGDLLGIMVGQPPRLREGILIQNDDPGAGLHYEAFYRARINDHISITPGIFFVTDPGHIPNNNDIFVAALRTVFSF